MLDFTSALYLGLRHGRDELPSWAQLTSGRPAALEPPRDEPVVAARLAALMGCERGLTAVSTLHLFWDLFGALAERPIALFVDEQAYPVMGWGVERAAGRGVPVERFGHHDAGDLERRIAAAEPGRRPVVVADGYCPSCGGAAPLPAYLEAARRRGGMVMLDDTQALGILGRGGGGSGRVHGAGGREELLLVASLAKAFGVPMAVAAGAGRAIEWLEARAETRAYASPPSAVLYQAAAQALAINEARGDRLRARLRGLARRFRAGLRAAEVEVVGGEFPVQVLRPRHGTAVELYRGLLGCGVRTVLTRSRSDGKPAVTLLLTAAHADDEVDRAAAAVVRLTEQRQMWRTCDGVRMLKLCGAGRARRRADGLRDRRDPGAGAGGARRE
jgi:8-amino-7-oxononanoate synthase